MTKKTRRYAPHDIVEFLDIDEMLEEAELFAASSVEGTKEPRCFEVLYERQTEDGVLPALSSLGGKVLEIHDLIASIKRYRAEKKWDAACAQCVALGAYWSALARQPPQPEVQEEDLTKELKAFCLRKLADGLCAPSVTIARKFVEGREDLKKLRPSTYWRRRSFDQQWLKIKRWCETEHARRQAER